MAEMPGTENEKRPASEEETGKKNLYRAQRREMSIDELRAAQNNRGPGRGGPPGRGGMIREKPKDTKGTIIKLARYIGKSGGALILVLFVIMLFTTATTLLTPKVEGFLINCMTLGELEDGTMRLFVDFDGVMLWLGVMAVIYILNCVLSLIQTLVSARLSQWTVYRLRSDLFRKIEYLPIRYTDTHPHGDLMSRMTNDVDNVSNAISQSVTSLISSVLTLIGAFAMIIISCLKAPVMILIAVCTIPLTFFLSAMLSKFMRKYFVERQVLLGSMNSQIEEMVTGHKTVTAYGKEEMAIDAFVEVSEDFRKCSIKANVWGGVMGPVMNVVSNLNYLLVAAFGGYFCLKGMLIVGDIHAILKYSQQFSFPISQIANQFATILTAVAGAERIFAILESDGEPDEGKSTITLDDIKGNIELCGVDFSYVEGERVLKNLDLSVKQGQKIAIVGATGSGKTTIVNLITRFYDIDGGSITIDGVDIRDIPKNTLRSAIAIVLQDTVLFSDTIGANIRYGRLDATDEEVKAAAATANADGFVSRLPDGYNTMLAESGSNISQGQRQLLSIARAVLADPKILILDEATSSVDTRTEMRIQEAMYKLMEGRTSLIIAHRLSTIRDADVIVVISGGRVVEAGNHDELLAVKGEYYKLYQTQFAGFAT